MIPSMETPNFVFTEKFIFSDGGRTLTLTRGDVVPPREMPHIDATLFNDETIYTYFPGRKKAHPLLVHRATSNVSASREFLLHYKRQFLYLCAVLSRSLTWDAETRDVEVPHIIAKLNALLRRYFRLYYVVAKGQPRVLVYMLDVTPNLGVTCPRGVPAALAYVAQYVERVESDNTETALVLLNRTGEGPAMGELVHCTEFNPETHPWT